MQEILLDMDNAINKRGKKTRKPKLKEENMNDENERK